jgi:glycosyltransferase 2 family protein
MNLLNFVKIVLGVGVLVYLVYFVGLAEIYNTLLGVDFAYIPLIVLVFIASVAMRAFNFKVLLSPQENKISLSKLVKISILSWAAGMFTPGKVGEFSSIYLLNKEGFETKVSASVSLLNKGITLLTILAFAVVGLTMILGIMESLQLIVVFAVLTVVPYVLIINSLSRKLIINLFGRFLRKYESQFAGFAEELDNYLSKRKMLLVYVFLLNVAWVAVSALLFVLAFLAVGQKVGFVDVMLINSIGITTSFIPVTIGGTGLREASAIVFFGKLGITNTAILGSHLIIAAVSFTLAGLTAFAFLFRKD